MGIGRWVAAGDDLRYEPKGTPGTVTALAARRPVATEGIWAGGPGGLYRYDGRIFPSIDGIREVPVSCDRARTTTARAPGSARTRHGLYHAEGDHAAPVPGGEAIFLDAVLGVAKTAAGTRLVAGNAGGRGAALRADDGGRRGIPAPRPGRSWSRWSIAAGDGDVLIAGPPGKPQAYTLRALGAERGAAAGQHQVLVAGEGAHRPLGGGARGRQAAAGRRRWPRRPGADLFVGSAHMGVARAAPESAAVRRRVPAGRRRAAALRRVRLARALLRRHRRAARLADRRRSATSRRAWASPRRRRRWRWRPTRRGRRTRSRATRRRAAW